MVGDYEGDGILISGHFSYDLSGVIGILSHLHQEGWLEYLEVADYGIAYLVLVLDTQDDKTAHGISPLLVAGSTTVKQVIPGSDSTEIDPLCRTTMSFTI